MRVFISHSSQDLTEVRALKDALETRGVSCWLAPDEIDFGNDYAERLMEGIQHCDATVVVLSRASMKSRHVRREIEIADGFEHIFYPVRILDLLLAQEFSYFLKHGQWIDLFSGEAETRYDELASAIKAGRELERRRNTRRARVLWTMAAVSLIGISAAVVGLLLFQNRIDHALRGPTAFEDLFPNTFAEVWRDSSTRSQLTVLNDLVFYLQGFPMQTDPVEVLVLDPTDRVVGQFSAKPDTKNGLNELRVPILTTSDTLKFCLAFRDGSERYALIKSISPAATFDANRRFIRLEGDENCIAATGVTPEQEELKPLVSAMKAAQLERKYPFALISDLAIYPRDEDKYELRFSRAGGWGGTGDLPMEVSVVIEAGPDKKNWPHGDIVRHGSDGRFQYNITYERPLDRYVRICVTTELQSDSLFIHHEKHFALTGDRTDYLTIGRSVRPILNKDPMGCRQSRALSP